MNTDKEIEIYIEIKRKSDHNLMYRKYNKLKNGNIPTIIFSFFLTNMRHCEEYEKTEKAISIYNSITFDTLHFIATAEPM